MIDNLQGKIVMGQVTYEAVVKQAEQLTPQEQQALIEHLKTSLQPDKIDTETWLKLFDSLKIDGEVLTDFSNRRVDWYDDNGR
jgi:hypothetical protein